MGVALLESRPIGGAQPRQAPRAARTPRRRGWLRAPAASALAWVALLAATPPANADVGEKIVLRCTHNESLSGFSQSAYRKALKELSADTEEYSDCASRIRQAQLAAAGARGGGGGGGAVSAPAAPLAASPAEQRALASAPHAGAQPVKLDGQVVQPGIVHVDVASALSSLPTPLLATLALLLAGLLGVGGGALRNRVRGRPR